MAIQKINPADLNKEPDMFYDGVVVFITDVSVKSDKFKLVEIGLDCTRTLGGTPFTNFVKFQAANAKIEMLDDVKVGDRIRAHFNLQGQLKDQKAGTPDMARNPDRKEIFTNPNVWRIQMIEEASGSTPPASAPSPVQSAPLQQTPETSDDLPF